MRFAFTFIESLDGSLYAGETAEVTLRNYPDQDFWNEETETWQMAECTVTFTREGDFWVYDWTGGEDGSPYWWLAVPPGCITLSETFLYEAAMAIKPTNTEVIAEGQLQLAYFPNCSTVEQMNTFLNSRIDDADAEVQLRTGDYYTQGDSNIDLLLHKAEIYLVLGRCWQIIKEVMDAYDAEALPPEFVDPGSAADSRDWYLQQGENILQRYDGDTAQPKGEFVGAFQSGGVEETEETVLGLFY